MIEERLKFDFLEFHSSTVIGKDGKQQPAQSKDLYIPHKMQK